MPILQKKKSPVCRRHHPARPQRVAPGQRHLRLILPRTRRGKGGVPRLWSRRSSFSLSLGAHHDRPQRVGEEEDYSIVLPEGKHLRRTLRVVVVVVVVTSAPVMTNKTKKKNNNKSAFRTDRIDKFLIHSPRLSYYYPHTFTMIFCKINPTLSSSHFLIVFKLSFLSQTCMIGGFFLWLPDGVGRKKNKNLNRYTI